MHRPLAWATVLSALLASPTAAQGSDTLSLQPIANARITSPAEDSMPASHRSARDSVDRPVEVTYCPSPSYPLALQAFSGFVELLFVVDTLGRPEVDDMVVSGSSNVGFVSAARRAVAKCRFIPARKDGRPVRQLVSQRVIFHAYHPDSARSESP
jgi:TonB family protein